MTDLFSIHGPEPAQAPQPPAAIPKPPPYAHPHFKVGDRVSPRAEWRADPQNSGVPSGIVQEVQKHGAGALLRVGDDRRWFISGSFEHDEGNESCAS